MDENLRARIAGALSAAGITGARDTTTRMRPQWRASFGYSGEIQGEKAYLHIYVPVDIDNLQVNCAIPASALDSMTTDQLRAALAVASAPYTVGSPRWRDTLAGLGISPADVAGWEVATVPHRGIQHRMVLTRVTLPLASLSGKSVAMAIALSLTLDRLARESVTVSWEASQGGE